MQSEKTTAILFAVSVLFVVYATNVTDAAALEQYAAGVNSTYNETKRGSTAFETEIEEKKVYKHAEILEELENAFSKAKTEQEHAAIKAEAQKYLLVRGISGASDNRAECNMNNIKLGDTIWSMSMRNESYNIPFTRTTCDNGVLEVKIHQDFATMENMKKYEKIVRSILGNETDLKISNGGDYWKLAKCPNGPKNDCSPLESGIAMQVKNHGSCTIGMKATFNGTNGFVTAGHCADGEKGSTVGQDSTSSPIGIVVKETYDKGSQYELCDCAYIEVSSGTRTMKPSVYWDSYYPVSADSAQVMDYVKIYGQSGKTLGYVENTCDTYRWTGNQAALCSDNDQRR